STRVARPQGELSLSLNSHSTPPRHRRLRSSPAVKRAGANQMGSPCRKAASEVVAMLGLQPHPDGGFYKETLRDESIVLSRSQLPPRFVRTLFPDVVEHAKENFLVGTSEPGTGPFGASLSKMEATGSDDGLHLA
ncbi:hypothetical protein Taro_020267, partial [Colocasia esculenta]|nr:hypothetical protein [Colocasia esculenta]